MDIPISNNRNQILNRQVIGFGEALLDCIIEDGILIKAIPGGSVLNSLVSLARCGVQTQFITDFGSDGPGEVIRHFLIEESVGDQYISVFENGKTALAFATLDAQKNATYTFYKDYPKPRIFKQLPEFKSPSILLFGSTASIHPDTQDVINSLLVKAKSHQAMIYFDPNIRTKAIDRFGSEWNNLMRNFTNSTIIRGSDEDFITVLGTDNISEIFEHLQPTDCKLLIVTSGGTKVQILTPHLNFEMAIPAIDVINTIGAGDAFNAGLICALLVDKIQLAEIEFLNKEKLKKLVEMALFFSSEVCQSSDNYLNKALAPKIA